MIRHWDVRRLPPPSLRGAAYLDRLEEVFRELAAEAYDDPGVLLPLTGGLDSRLFAAAAPPDKGVSTLTFGSPKDHDCALAARVAAVRGLPHAVSPLDPAYVAAYGPEAVWLLEGRLSPVGNITGSLMDRLRPATAFISGAGAAAGRHFWRSRMLVPGLGLGSRRGRRVRATLHVHGSCSSACPWAASPISSSTAQS